MNFKKKLAIWSLVMVLVLGLGFASIPPAKAQFVLSSAWDYPDEYGQGIAGYFLLENSSGAWWPFPGSMIVPTNDSIFEVEAGCSIGLDVRVTLNYTYFELTHPDDFLLGLNYIRLNVTVITPLETVFSQSNFTYDDLGGEDDGVWWYSQEVFFDFITELGEIYTATITYEIYDI